MGVPSCWFCWAEYRVFDIIKNGAFKYIYILVLTVSSRSNYPIIYAKELYYYTVQEGLI